MKVLVVVVLSLVVLARAQQQQLINPFFGEGLVPYGDWQAQVAPNAVFNVGPLQQQQQQLQQFLAAQQFPGLVQQLPGPQVVPSVPLPFPAQYPYPVPQPQLPVPVPLPLPQLPPVPVFNAFQQTPLQFQMVRHGLPHSDAAAVSFSSLHYNNGAAAQAPGVPVTSSASQAPAVVSSGAKPASVAPAPASTPSSVVKDIATFGTEYGTGADKAPVARYEAINAGSVHVAPLPGHTVDQKLVAPGTVEQKA